MEISKRVEKFIQEHTRNCSNLAHFGDINGNVWEDNTPWLTPNDARKAVEITREEIYEWLQKVSFDDYKVADEESYRMGFPYDYIDVHELINNLKQTIKNE